MGSNMLQFLKGRRAKITNIRTIIVLRIAVKFLHMVLVFLLHSEAFFAEITRKINKMLFFMQTKGDSVWESFVAAHTSQWSDLKFDRNV